MGRRIAYDAATGRLWVVCRQCARWNLSPVDTRWEAIEEAERAFRQTKMRVHTENIGLAQLSEGLELVRVGKPLQLEFAAWRYGNQFGKRRVKFVAVGATVGLVGTVLPQAAMWVNLASATHAMAMMELSLAGTLVGISTSIAERLRYWHRAHIPKLAVRSNDGTLLRLTHSNARCVTIASIEEKGWTLKLPYVHVQRAGRILQMMGSHEKTTSSKQSLMLTGASAEQALATVLPHINRDGASQRGLTKAVDTINESRDVTHMLQTALKETRASFLGSQGGAVGMFPGRIRLALEMSLHQDEESRAMEGELHLLEARWRDADAIARIADNMLLPADIEKQLSDLRRR